MLLEMATDGRLDFPKLEILENDVRARLLRLFSDHKAVLEEAEKLQAKLLMLEPALEKIGGEYQGLVQRAMMLAKARVLVLVRSVTPLDSTWPPAHNKSGT